MTIEELRRIYDNEERVNVMYPDAIRDAGQLAIRHVDMRGLNNFVIYSKLNDNNVDAVIREQVTFFEQRGTDFEWKVYDHDRPPDLKDRLAQFGFAVEEAESVMALELENAPATLTQGSDDRVQRITDPEKVADVMSVQRAVWGNKFDWLEKSLSHYLRKLPDYAAVYAAYVNGVPASAAWMFLPEDNLFASLWGGSTLEQHRKQGLYTGLLAVRAQEAVRRGRRYLTVDASELSRPILEKFGFVKIATSWPCKWTAKGESQAY